MTDSIHHAAERIKSLARQRIARLDLQRFLEAARGVAVHLFSQIRAPQVVMRKVARLVAERFGGALEPWNGFIEAAQLDQIRADIVIGIAEFRIELNGAYLIEDRKST